MRGLGRLAMFRRDRRGRGGRLRWRVRGGTNGMGGCRRVVRVLLACRRVCLCRLSWCPCLSVGHPPIARRPPGGSRLGFVFECSGRSPPAVQVCLLGRRMFTRVGRSPFVFVSFIRCAPAFWAWGSTLVPECKTRPMQPGYVTCVDSVVCEGFPQQRISSLLGGRDTVSPCLCPFPTVPATLCPVRCSAKVDVFAACYSARERPSH